MRILLYKSKMKLFLEWASILIKIGYLLHRVPSGRLLIKLSTTNIPKLGSKVLNSKGEVIGFVCDVIGPVRSPFAVVKPISKEVQVSQYEEVFLKR